MSSNSMASPHCSFHLEVNQTKIKGGCQSERKVLPHDSKSDLPLVHTRHTYIAYIMLLTYLPETLEIILFSSHLRV